MNFKVLYTLLMTGFYAIAIAQEPGSLDPTYATNGKFQHLLGTANAFSRSMVIQPDGKAVIACISNNGIGSDFTIIRLTTEGELDTSFGEGGIVFTDFDLKTDIAQAVALDEFNRIIVTGSVDNGNGLDFAAARYLPDGTLDETFSEDGLQVTPLGITSFCTAVAIQSDNKIVLGGYTLNPFTTTNEFALVRYNTDGTPDSTFHQDGIVTTNMNIGPAAAFAMDIQTDGRIILAGQIFDESTFLWNIGIARYDDDGTLDETFDEDGVALTETPGVNHTVNAVAIQSDQKIVVAGFSGTAPSDNLFTVGRYHADGTPDDEFGTDGLVIDSYGAQDNQINAIAIQPDGHILIAGSRTVGITTQFAIARLDTKGDFDDTFGDEGVAISVIGQNDGVSAMALQDDGKLVVAGESFNGARFEIVAARYVTRITTRTEEPVHPVFNAIVYPNPVIEELTLSYVLKQATEISIELIDVSGNRVHVFANRQMQASGVYEDHFTMPETLPTGIYWLTIRSADSVTGVEVDRIR